MTSATTATKTEQRHAGGEYPDLYRSVRARSEAMIEPLSEADCQIQSMACASPTKWHLAHTSWFWETFLLRPHLDAYSVFDPKYEFLFNSYYEALGPRHARPQRGLISRPSLDEILGYRAHVDAGMERLFNCAEAALEPMVALGCAHEQQHQELILTDIKHALSCNPTDPAMVDGAPQTSTPASSNFVSFPGGRHRIGFSGEGFAYDNEGPEHTVWLEDFSIASDLVRNRDVLAFIADGGYRTASLWLSDGWSRVQAEQWQAPLYWRDDAGEWSVFTLYGTHDIDPDAPACHLSFFEADAVATWLGARLPTEQEWEVAARAGEARDVSVDKLEHEPRAGRSQGEGLRDLFGSVWQWTASAYRPYPRYTPAAGAVGEYNGKFMSGQMVLRGSSVATPPGHSRPSYRNFFYPEDRWQYSGLRLARDA